MNTIGERLKELRKKEKLTQQQLADKLGCSHQSISCYENNRHINKIQDFIKICKYFDKDMYYLITGLKNNKGSEITLQEQQIISAYNNLIPNSDKQKIVNFIMGIGECDTSKIVNFPKPESNASYVYVCPQKASAGIGKIEDESNHDLKLVSFDEGVVPPGTTHGIIIDGHSMEDKFFDKQIVFIQNGLECAPSDYGIFSVTNSEDTKIYCKQLMQREDGSKYLHSMNKEEGDPDIDYKNVIDVHCVGKILL